MFPPMSSPISSRPPQRGQVSACEARTSVLVSTLQLTCCTTLHHCSPSLGFNFLFCQIGLEYSQFSVPTLRLYVSVFPSQERGSWTRCLQGPLTALRFWDLCFEIDHPYAMCWGSWVWLNFWRQFSIIPCIHALCYVTAVSPTKGGMYFPGPWLWTHVTFALSSQMLADVTQRLEMCLYSEVCPLKLLPSSWEEHLARALIPGAPFGSRRGMEDMQSRTSQPANSWMRTNAYYCVCHWNYVLACYTALLW